MVERNLAKVDVESSNLFSRSTLGTHCVASVVIVIVVVDSGGGLRWVGCFPVGVGSR